LASILVVDDDGPLRAALMRALRSAGHSVDEAANGTHALAVIEAEAPDVLLTDIIMANGDGIELINAVRRNHSGVRVIAMSGRGSMGQVELLKLAQMLGADGVISKPFDVEDLLAKVAALS
jgi:DNA-binding response OmpR family regulator